MIKCDFYYCDLNEHLEKFLMYHIFFNLHLKKKNIFHHKNQNAVGKFYVESHRESCPIKLC